MTTDDHWKRLLEPHTTFAWTERTSAMPGKAVQRLDTVDSIRAVCQQCSWAGGPGPAAEGNAQDHCRAFGHTTVTITMTLPFYTPAPKGTDPA